MEWRVGTLWWRKPAERSRLSEASFVGPSFTRDTIAGQQIMRSGRRWPARMFGLFHGSTVDSSSSSRFWRELFCSHFVLGLCFQRSLVLKKLPRDSVSLELALPAWKAD